MGRALINDVCGIHLYTDGPCSLAEKAMGNIMDVVQSVGLHATFVLDLIIYPLGDQPKAG